MKNILLINNTIFYEDDGELYLNKETGNFFVQLQNLGNKVSAFQISQPKTDKDSFANFSLSGKGVKIYEVKRKSNRYLAFLKSFFVIQKALLKNDFVYIFYPGPICLIIALLCMLYRKPFGLYIRGEQGINSKLSIKIIKKAKIIFTISPKFTQIISRFNVNTHTIRPMVGFLESDIKQAQTINFDKTINLLYVGRLVFDKGLFELIDAVRILKDKKYDVHLNLVGGGTDYDNLQLKVNALNLKENVTFFGMVSEKQKLINIYNSNDIFVLPTYHEGFPRVLYEAMMMQIPIITTFVGTINFLMKDEYNCLELKVKDINSIVSAVERLISKPQVAQNISDQGRKTIIEYLVDKKIKHVEHLNNFIEQDL